MHTITVENRRDEQFTVQLEDAFATTGAVRLIGPGLAVLTFIRRSLLKIRHVPEELLDAVLYPVLFVLMFTYIFGGVISGTPRRISAVRVTRYSHANRPLPDDLHRNDDQH